MCSFPGRGGGIVQILLGVFLPLALLSHSCGTVPRVVFFVPGLLIKCCGAGRLFLLIGFVILVRVS